MRYHELPFDEDWEAVWADALGRAGLPRTPPDDSLGVASAAVAGIAAAPAVLAHLGVAAPAPPGTWASRDGRTPAAPGRLGSYLRELDLALVGADGGRLGEFLEWLLVRSQILAFRRLDGEASSGFRAYLPRTRVRPEGGGDNRRAICPFHAERSPSMVFSLTSRSWHCYGCGLHLSHVGLAARLLLLGDREAADLLRRSVGMPRPPWQLPAPRRSRALLAYGWLLGVAADSVGKQKSACEREDSRGAQGIPACTAKRVSAVERHPDAEATHLNVVRTADAWDEAAGRGRLEGPAGNCVKASSFRGFRSEGTLLPAAEAPGGPHAEGADVTAALGVTFAGG